MNTRLTVADCRANLYAEIDPSDANSAAFLPALNEVCERYTNSGKWKGALVETVFASAAGYITLPWDFLGVLAMRYNKWSGSPIFSQYRQYMEFGPGEIEDTWKWPGALFDMGDGFPVQVSITEDEPGSIRIYSTGSDNGKTMRLFGIQEETGEPIYDNSGDEGEAITLTAPFVTSAYHYSKITGVQKDLTNGPVTLKLAPTGGGTEYQLSYYQPNETRPMYRRYQTGVAEEAIKVLCQRRFTILRNETDWVIPGNLTALRYGLKARFYEEAQDMERADAAFAKGLDWLNQEAKAARGGVRPDMLIQPFPDGLVFPWTT